MARRALTREAAQRRPGLRTEAALPLAVALCCWGATRPRSSAWLAALARRSCAVLALALLFASPAAAQVDCPKYDVVADAASAEIVTKQELTGWARQALKDRYEEGATCFVFVAVISANTATATYVSLRASRAGERVVLAETQSVATGTKAYRRRGLRKALDEFIAEKTAG